MWEEGLEIARRIRAWERGERPGPYTLELYPTLRCNMGCVYCDTRYRDPSRRDDLSPADLADLVDDAAAMDVRRVLLLGGGEPLVSREATVPLFRRIKDAGMEGVLATNGSLLDEGIRRELVDVGWDEVQVSIDAADPRINDYLRGTPGALHRVARNVCGLRGLRRAAGRRAPRLLIHAVVTTKNVRGLPALVDMAGALGAYRLDVDLLIAYRPEQRALLLGDEDLRRLPELARRAAAAARRWDLQHNLDSLGDPRTASRGAMTLPRDGPRTVRHAPCLNPWYYLVVDASGCASPCCVITATGEDVRRRGLRWTWERGPLLAGMREQMLRKRVPDRCAECSMAMISRNDEIRRLLDEEA